MPAQNDVTGDTLTTGATSGQYRAGFDAIDWSATRKPRCFGQYRAGSIQAERDCETCPRVEDCKP